MFKQRVHSAVLQGTSLAPMVPGRSVKIGALQSVIALAAVEGAPCYMGALLEAAFGLGDCPVCSRTRTENGAHSRGENRDDRLYLRGQRLLTRTVRLNKRRQR